MLASEQEAQCWPPSRRQKVASEQEAKGGLRTGGEGVSAQETDSGPPGKRGAAGMGGEGAGWMARGLEAWSWDGGPLRGCRRGAQVDRFGGGICWASGRRGNRVSAREYSAIADSSGLRPHHDI